MTELERLELRMAYLAKERKTSPMEYLNKTVETDFFKSKGYKKGRPFYCVQTREVFASGKECCEKFGMSLNELNDCLRYGVEFNGYTFEFIG